MAAGGVVAGVVAVALSGAPAAGDSFTPVRASIQVAPVARLHVPLAITVRISADAGALDDRSAPLRVRVKLAAECGGTYEYTEGPVLVDKRLSPQPATGRPYAGAVSGSGEPTRYGVQTVCLWLEEEGDNRVFYSDQSVTVDVSRACTVQAARYDRLRRRGRGRRRARGRRRGHSRSERRDLARQRRLARRACGKGVRL